MMVDIQEFTYEKKVFLIGWLLVSIIIYLFSIAEPFGWISFLALILFILIDKVL